MKKNRINLNPSSNIKPNLEVTIDLPELDTLKNAIYNDNDELYHRFHHLEPRDRRRYMGSLVKDSFINY
jgi:hypothetical protein